MLQPVYNVTYVCTVQIIYFRYTGLQLTDLWVFSEELYCQFLHLLCTGAELVWPHQAHSVTFSHFSDVSSHFQNQSILGYLNPSHLMCNPLSGESCDYVLFCHTVNIYFCHDSWHCSLFFYKHYTALCITNSSRRHNVTKHRSGCTCCHLPFGFIIIQ